MLYAKRMVDGVQISEHEFRYVYAIYSITGAPAYVWFIYNDSLDTITSVTKQLFDAVSYSTLTSTLSNYALKSEIPTVNNPTITFTQGGVSKGSITLNQSSNQTIALDTGGSNYTAGSGIDITNDVISIDNTVALKTDIPTVPTNVSAFTNDAGYITSSALPTVNNNTITITQGGVTKGSFTLNQSTNQTIDVDDVPGMIGEVLYDVPNGQTGVNPITMAHSFADYSYVDIQYRNYDNAYEVKSVRVYDPNGKHVYLD